MKMADLIQLVQGMPPGTVFFVGLAIRLIIGMRQFNRRGVGGLQHFNNYFVGLFTLIVEWVLKWGAAALMVWGLWGWIVK
ncbi:hypothetical protein G5B00_03360 [Parapedobacter sp. SGR-10]|uniref:hypothetical protein n=1 Tax=Parapedobacter sp. SGR-10 TaxID=2710879 RepID=UPI0013D797EE|nr:hypothetical protein [Parapedobacter sp. SGR-10]NGF55541.1 hypothetical protein [Parapedobacter sp. SGR-10]